MSATVFEMELFTETELVELEKTVFQKKQGFERIEAIRKIVFGWIAVNHEKAFTFIQRVEKRICDLKFIELMEISKTETNFTLEEKIASVHNICEGYTVLGAKKKIHFLKNVGYVTQSFTNAEFIKSVRAILDEWEKVQEKEEASQFLDCLESNLVPSVESHDRKRDLKVKEKQELKAVLAEYYEHIDKPRAKARILEIPV